MTERARRVAVDQFNALMSQAEPALWGTVPGEGFTLDPAGTVRAFRAHALTAAELRTIAAAATAVANAAWDAALADMATTLINTRRGCP